MQSNSKDLECSCLSSFSIEIHNLLIYLKEFLKPYVS